MDRSLRQRPARRLRKWLLRGGTVVGLLVVAGVVGEQWARWRALRDFAPPGRLVEVDGTSIHLHCIGRGAPVVVLESGTGAPALSWRDVQQEIAKFTRVCSYDRPGLGWSGPRGDAGDAVEGADRLHTLLAAASERPPFVLVGHSLGGPRSLVYAHRHPAEVAGFVFVDATHPDWRRHLPAELTRESGAQRLRRWLFLSALTETGALRAFQALLADEPEGADRRVARAFGPQNLGAAMREGEWSESTLAQARTTRSLGDRPVVVLSAGSPPLEDGLSPEMHGQVAELRMRFQRELATRSTRGEHRVVAGAGHTIQRDAPQAVVSAVRDVTDAVRGNGPVGPEALP